MIKTLIHQNGPLLGRLLTKPNSHKSYILFNDFSTFGLLNVSNLINRNNNTKSSRPSYNYFNLRSYISQKHEINTIYPIDNKINLNFAGKIKHYPPANKEWVSSIYAYNKHSAKVLPCLDKSVSKLIKAYFNVYSRGLEKKVSKMRSRRSRVIGARLSTNRFFVSNAELKHTGEKVIVTVYVYNNKGKYHLNKLSKIPTIDRLGELLQADRYVIANLSHKILTLKLKIKLQENHLYSYLKNRGLNFNKHNFAVMCRSHEKNYMETFVSKFLRREITSVYFKQLLRFNKLKFEDRYASMLRDHISIIYNKKIELNIVNLKYLFLSSSIFSSTLVAKIRNRKNRFLKVLKDSLLMFNLPPVNRQALYDEIYNKKRLPQNLGLKDVLTQKHTSNKPLAHTKGSNEINMLDHSDVAEKGVLEISRNNMDILDRSLINVVPETKLGLDSSREILFNRNHSDKLGNVMSNLKHKSVNGIRIELAGRLTKRNTAARSLSKLRYKGNIRNMDSSDKGLSTVMLRGHAKSNVEFSMNKHKIRIGSYGFKGWISTS